MQAGEDKMQVAAGSLPAAFVLDFRSQAIVCIYYIFCHLRRQRRASQPAPPQRPELFDRETIMMQPEQCTLYSGGLQGAEAAFGEAAEKWGVKEVIYTFPGKSISRAKNLTVLSDSELVRGDISMELASKMMGRNYYEAEKIRKVLQTIFHMVNSGHQIFVVGTIQEDNTVKGGTGWAVELGKLFNRPLSVFDQDRSRWYTWKEGAWVEDLPKVEHDTFVGTGTRNLTDAGKQAIADLFTRSFG